jgi:ABC-type lipoprotein export system ATPase subunit
MTQLRLESIGKTYVQGGALHRAVSDISFDVCAGEFIAIYGGPRSGKSTLLRIAAGIEAPDTGSVRYDGRDLGSMSERELADYRLGTVGWVSDRRPSLPGFRAIDYVAVPALGAGADPLDAASRARDALREVGAEYCANTALLELSESEHPRVQIARALVRHPSVVLADEPVAGLGVSESRAILRLLYKLAHDENMAVVVSASDMTELLGVDRLVWLASGGGAVEHHPESVQRGQLVEFPGGRRRSDA